MLSFRHQKLFGPEPYQIHAMKTCPVCDTDYPDEHTNCVTDGAVLLVSREFAPGSLVRGKYRIVRKIGQGGMGVVYLAEDTWLNVRVALKFLAGDLGKDPRFIKRFRTEARAAYQLRHANIAEVTNLDQADDGSLFIAMEYVEGPSLRVVLDQHPRGLEIHRALEIAKGIVAGLAAAHAQGTVHRDIKPENILITRAADGTERAKILDFGIAAVAESVTRMTRTQGFLLTYAYAAPEQWEEMPADEMDGRTDLYALGCVLYEMLTGTTPFHAHSTAGWMKHHMEEPPRPPSSIRPEIAGWRNLDELILALLTKDRNYRPAGAYQLLGSLDTVGWHDAPRPETAVAPESNKRKQTVAERIIPAGPPNTGTTLEPEPAKEPFSPLNVSLTPTKLPERSRSVAKFVWVLVFWVAVAYFGYRQFRAHGAAGIEERAEALNKQRNYAEAIPLFDQACDAGNFHGCANLGWAYQNGKGVDVDISRAIALYTKACDGGNAYGCDNLGWAYQHGLGVVADPSRAAALFSKGCDGGNTYACSSLGEAYQHGSGVSLDLARAATLFTKACDGGNPYGCANLGWAYENGSGVTKDVARSTTLYGKACDGGNAYGCDNLGWAYQHGLGVGVDNSRAATLYSKACDGGNLNGCNSLGVAYKNGWGVSQDISRAVTLYAKACDGGNASGCDNLGWAYQNGKGVVTDLPRAAALYTKACDAGSSHGCTNQGWVYEHGQGVVEDDAKAAALYLKACDGGNDVGCSNIGKSYHYGWLGLSKDLDKARQYLGKGCQLGFQPACDDLKKVG